MAVPSMPQVCVVTKSTGTTIAQLRAQGEGSSYGDRTSSVVDALAGGFADATRGSLLVATVFLVLGFVGALRLQRAARD